MLDERKKLVLQAIIDDYIETAEPVGSRAIARRYNLGVSPATIRNEMADLEETGYLQQPHISAGRIPSDKGYRFYVDVLMQPERVAVDGWESIHARITQKRQEMDALIQETSDMLSLLTEHIAVVVAPSATSCLLRHLQLVPIDPQTILLVMVLEPGLIQNRLLAISEPQTPGEVLRVSHVLNEKLKGLSYRELRPALVKDVLEECGQLGAIVVQMLQTELALNKTEKMSLSGTIHIFNQPEFRDIEKAKTLIGALEKRSELFRVLDAISRMGGVQVAIGRENHSNTMEDCSVVASSYHMGRSVIGTIGVIGPTRMEYSRVVAVVDLMANLLSEVLTQSQ